MRLVSVSHSNVHIRQQHFFRELSRLGHDVLVISPDEWGAQRAFDSDGERFQLKALSAMGPLPPNPYDFILLGLEDTLVSFTPEVVYVQQEPGSKLLAQCAELCAKHGWRLAIFTWENMALRGGDEELRAADLVICGNEDAERLVKPHNDKTIILPQVGIDTEHFAPRDVARNVPVAYIGRAAPEKGIAQLGEAYPQARFLEWKPYLELPWWYSRALIVVCYSQDTDRWREQAMPYVAMEAISCGAFAIVSDAGSIPFWHLEFAGQCPASGVIPQNNLATLRNNIEYWLINEHVREDYVKEGRAWVKTYLGSRAIAERLVQCLSDVD